MKYFCRSIVLAWVFLAFAGYAPPVHANCTEECLGRHDCDGDYDTGRIRDAGNECRMYLDDCQDECSGSGNKNIYGALAYDRKTAAWGLADPSPDADSARQNALNLCKPNGPECAVVATYSKTCVSVAAGKNSIVAWAEGGAIDNAQDSARDDCKDKGGGACAIKQSHCYFP